MAANILIINGRLGGENGNTSVLLKRLGKELESRASVPTFLHLAHSQYDQTSVRARLEQADALVFATGTYWDSWGSPLQKFFEDMTDLEAGPTWMGKPAATIVTMHSVGGKEVMSRLQGVLTTLGLLIPPMGGLVYSLANHLALKTEASDFHDDLWHLDDLAVIAENLLITLEMKRSASKTWAPWPVDHNDPYRRWL